MECLECGQPLTGKQKKFCSKACKNKYFDENIRAEYSRTKAREVKFLLVRLKGGKCEKCGYSRNLGALSFHHRNPREKCFEIDARNCANRTIISLLTEADKCQLLCCNCHAEAHNPDLEITDSNIKRWNKNSGLEEMASLSLS